MNKHEKKEIIFKNSLYGLGTCTCKFSVNTWLVYAGHGEQRYTLSKVPVYKCYIRKLGKPRSSTCIYLHTVSMVLPVLLSTEGRSQYIVSKGVAP